MNGHGQSDDPVVPANSPNKAAGEERGSAKGNTAGKTRPGRSAGSGVSSALDRVRQVAVRDKEARFTALLHHVSLDRLRAAYWAINSKAAPGVDRVMWVDYGQDLEGNLRGLHDRVQAGRDRASPSRRVYIPKTDGRQRPLGIATLEDKIVQRAVVEVLNVVYEVACSKIPAHRRNRVFERDTISQSHHTRGPGRTAPRALTWPDYVFGKRTVHAQRGARCSAHQRCCAPGSGGRAETPQSRC